MLFCFILNIQDFISIYIQLLIIVYRNLRPHIDPFIIYQIVHNTIVMSIVCNYL